MHSPLRYLAAIQTDLPNPADSSSLPGRVTKLLEMIDHAVVGYAPFGDVRLVAFPEFAPPRRFTRLWRNFRQARGPSCRTNKTDRYVAEGEGAKRPHPDRHVPGGGQEVSRLRLQHHLPHRPQRAALQVPQGPSVDSLGVQPAARRTRLRGAAVPGRRDADRHDRLRRSATTGSSPRPFANSRCRGPRSWSASRPTLDPWGATPPMDWWTVVNRCRVWRTWPSWWPRTRPRACRTTRRSPGRAGAWWSITMANPSQADPGPGEKIVVGPIDLAALRADRERRKAMTSCHRRVEAYRAQGQRRIRRAVLRRGQSALRGMRGR